MFMVLQNGFPCSLKKDNMTFDCNREIMHFPVKCTGKLCIYLILTKKNGYRGRKFPVCKSEFFLEQISKNVHKTEKPYKLNGIKL